MKENIKMVFTYNASLFVDVGDSLDAHASYKQCQDWVVNRSFFYQRNVLQEMRNSRGYSILLLELRSTDTNLAVTQQSWKNTQLRGKEKFEPHDDACQKCKCDSLQRVVCDNRVNWFILAFWCGCCIVLVCKIKCCLHHKKGKHLDLYGGTSILG